MSSILEALRKLEEEKAARRGGMGNIAGRVTAGSRRNRQKPAWLMAAAMVAVAVAAICCTYAVMRASSTPLPTVAVKPTESAALPAASSPPDAVPGMTTAALPLSSPPQLQDKPEQGKAVAGGKKALVVAAPKKGSAPATAQGGGSAAKTAPAPQPSAGVQSSPLKVTGIAWQQDSGSRVAVVNGVPVTEESVIEGARVEEILPDSVRFSRQGEDFRINLEKAPE